MNDLTDLVGTSATNSAILWLTMTLLAYLAALRLYRYGGGHPLLLPILTSVTMIIAVLLLTDTPYADYAESTQFLYFLIGPATVALAVPLYNQLERLKQLWRPVLAALVAGALTAIFSGVGLAMVLGASPETVLSLAPKSATMPIAMEVGDLMGGLPSFTAIAVAATGIAGAVLAGGLFKLLRIGDPAIEGFALGLTAHAIGTARALKDSQTSGAFAALGMGLNGVATAIFVPAALAVLDLF